MVTSEAQLGGRPWTIYVFDHPYDLHGNGPRTEGMWIGAATAAVVLGLLLHPETRRFRQTQEQSG